MTALDTWIERNQNTESTATDITVGIELFDRLFSFGK